MVGASALAQTEDSVAGDEENSESAPETDEGALESNEPAAPEGEEEPVTPSESEVSATDEPPANEAPEVSDPPPVEPVAQDPEPEVSEPVSQSAAEAAGDLGVAVAEPNIEEPSIEDDLADAEHEAAQPAEETGEEGGEEDQSTAGRLAAANPTAGLPWSMPVVWANTITTRTLAPGAQRTYNPYYNMTFSLRPRWNFTDALSIGLRQDVDIELTDSDPFLAVSNATTTNRQLVFQDTRFDLTYSLPWRPAGIAMTPSFGLRAPTSPFSRGAKRVLGVSGSFLAMRPFAVLGGLIPGIQVGYLYWSATSNVAQPRRTDGEDLTDEFERQNIPIYGRAIGTTRCTTAGPNGAVLDGDCGDGVGTGRHQLVATAFVTLVPADRWQINLSYTGLWIRGGNLGEACIGGTEDGDNSALKRTCFGDDSVTKWRTFGLFNIGFGYDLTSYLTASLSYSTLAIHPNTGGGIENPLWNENSTLSLSFQFRPSALAVELRADDSSEAARQTLPTAF